MPSTVAKVIIVIATIWLPVATQDLPPVNDDNLDPNAVHVCESTAQEAYTELQSFTQYYTQKTNTWCLNIPPRCTEYRIASRIAYKRVTKYRNRKTYFCCDGYKAKIAFSYCIPDCGFDCYEPEGQGVCVTPGTCLCREGYQGEFCQSGCAEDQWGPNCSNTCSCGEYGSCDPANGNCICHIGYTGTDCSQPCVDSFGLHCVNPCVCENNATCNNVNGRCTCQVGYFGEYCHRYCDVSTVGQEGCEQTCPCHNGGLCNDVTGNCDCLPGYMGEYCAERCDEYHYGNNCTELCTCNNGVCDHMTGRCDCEFGWGGERCEIDCESGWYGKACDTQCRCSNNGQCFVNSHRQILCNCTGTGHHGLNCTVRDCDYNKKLNTTTGACESCDCVWTNTDSCHVLTGACECEPGYNGHQCTEECTMPFYGQDCAELCMCENGLCHHVSGECTTCYAGYIGNNCDQECPAGKWGLECVNDCLCMNNAKCHASSGYCNCSAGYQGLFCEQVCPDHMFGRGCSNACTCNDQTATCNPYDGTCLCKPGYVGVLCDTQCEAGKFGHLCRHNCTCDAEGSRSCDPHTGECICKPGWSGVTCSSQCKADAWGQYCLKPCDCSGHGSCDHFTGVCICEQGYTGDKCEQMCGIGFYGYNCTDVCPQCNQEEVCDHRSGECVITSCPAGFIGTNCDDTCPRGRWGVNCANACSATCVQNGYCYPVNGYCQCFPGYMGTECDQDCPPGKFGYGCVNDCPCNQDNTESCDPRSGQCDCKSGYTGQFCDSRCQTGKWGPNCRLSCSAICTQANSLGCEPMGGLPCVCAVGFQGPTCAEETSVNVIGQRTGDEVSASSTPIIIACTIVGVILIVIIALLVVYFTRRIRKLNDKNLNVFYQANGTMDNHIMENGTSVGVVNPTYVEENRRNETRYPHLNQRHHTTPPLPQRPSCDDTFDDIAATKYPNLSRRNHETQQRSCDDNDDITGEKLRVSFSSQGSRRTSGNFADPDEDRYTTLKSVQGAPTLNRNITNTSGDTDYVLYTGPNSEGMGAGSEITNPQGHRRSSSRSSNGSAGYQNGTFVSETQNKDQHNTTKGFSQPLYDADISINSNKDILPITVNPTARLNTENPYDIPNNLAPSAASNSNQNGYQVPVTHNGYITPVNEINKNTNITNSDNSTYKDLQPNISHEVGLDDLELDLGSHNLGDHAEISLQNATIAGNDRNLLLDANRESPELFHSHA